MALDPKMQRAVGEVFHKMVDEFADSFKEQLDYIETNIFGHPQHEFYMAQWKDSVCLAARIFHKWVPSYDIEMFYTKCGYEGSHPQHI